MNEIVAILSGIETGFLFNDSSFYISYNIDSVALDYAYYSLVIYKSF